MGYGKTIRVSDTIINGQTLCTVAGAVIRRSTTGYPETEFDGTLVATITANGSIYDTNGNRIAEK